MCACAFESGEKVHYKTGADKSGSALHCRCVERVQSPRMEAPFVKSAAEYGPTQGKCMLSHPLNVTTCLIHLALACERLAAGSKWWEKAGPLGLLLCGVLSGCPGFSIRLGLLLVGEHVLALLVQLCEFNPLPLVPPVFALTHRAVSLKNVTPIENVVPIPQLSSSSHTLPHMPPPPSHAAPALADTSHEYRVSNGRD